MTSIRRSALPLATLALLLWPAAIAAQQSTTRGFNVGVHLSAASLTVESQDRNDAGGGGIAVGYGLNRNFTIFAQLDGAEFDEQPAGDLEGDWRLGHVDLGARYHFASSLRRWVPYLQAAFAYRAVTVGDAVFEGAQADEVELSGGGLSLGGGLGYYLNESFALDAQLIWTSGEFTTLRIDNTSRTGFDVDATSGRFNLGIVWWP